MMKGGTRHIVRIFRTKGKPARVDVGNALVKPGDSVVFDALSGDYTLFFPEVDVLFRGSPPPIVTVKQGSPSRPMIVAELEQGREFEYCIFCETGRQFVEVNSPPKMIIDR
jgi:hypothetical protein